MFESPASGKKRQTDSRVLLRSSLTKDERSSRWPKGKRVSSRRFFLAFSCSPRQHPIYPSVFPLFFCLFLRSLQNENLLLLLSSEISPSNRSLGV